MNMGMSESIAIISRRNAKTLIYLKVWFRVQVAVEANLQEILFTWNSKVKSLQN